MKYGSFYDSKIGKMLLLSENEALIGCYFTSQKHFPDVSDVSFTETPALNNAKKWLDKCFAGEKPDFLMELNPKGTPFQKEIWSILRQIPYGETKTYGEIASIFAKSKGKQSFSAQAVGQAIGANPLLIIIPCHRVIGANGNLTGYAGGLDKKIELLKLEGHRFNVKNQIMKD